MLRFVLSVPSVFVRAWVIMTLWGWYITPISGLEEITMPYAYGLSLFVSLLVANQVSLVKDTKSQTEEDKVALTILHYILPLSLLGFGYLGTLFM